MTDQPIPSDETLQDHLRALLPQVEALYTDSTRTRGDSDVALVCLQAVQQFGDPQIGQRPFGEFASDVSPGELLDAFQEGSQVALVFSPSLSLLSVLRRGPLISAINSLSVPV